AVCTTKLISLQVRFSEQVSGSGSDCQPADPGCHVGDRELQVLDRTFAEPPRGNKDDQMYHGKVGSRSSPGAAIACSEASSPEISFNVVVLGAAVLNNDGGGIWVEGNSMPHISYNWFAGNRSGDDGGGIYVMGNLYYDEEGKRHDSAPDGPVVVRRAVREHPVAEAGGPARGQRGGPGLERIGGFCHNSYQEVEP